VARVIFSILYHAGYCEFAKGTAVVAGLETGTHLLPNILLYSSNSRGIPYSIDNSVCIKVIQYENDELYF
jgi:hypothetical protein